MAKKRQKKQGGQQFLSDENYIRQRARTLKIGTCYVSDAIIKAGEGNIIVSGLHTGGGRVSIGVYLVDAYCLGLKDSFYRLRIEDYELEDIVSHPNQEIRKLLPKLEALYKTGLIDLRVCGDYGMVVRELKGSFTRDNHLVFLTDIRKQYRTIFPGH